MNKTFKKILPVLLLIWPYLCVIPFGIGSANEDFYGPVMGIYMVLTVAVYLLNIISVCMDKDKAAHRRLAFWDMVMKVAHIPFYLAVFVLDVLLFLTIVVPAMVFVTPFMVGILVAVDLMLMITTSLYGVNALLKGCRLGLLSKTYTVVHIVLHCFFVTDVISAVMIYFKLRKAGKREGGNYYV